MQSRAEREEVAHERRKVAQKERTSRTSATISRKRIPPAPSHTQTQLTQKKRAPRLAFSFLSQILKHKGTWTAALS